MHSSIRIVIICAVASFVLTDSCLAGFTFLGPTPYLSSADSPFAHYLGGPDFYLEDFEDGELNTPGIEQQEHHVYGSAFHATVMEPGEYTDSVDGDDRYIDGCGAAGHSLRSNAFYSNVMIPQRNTVSIVFQFNENELRDLPTAFGFVWTDGPIGIDYFRPGLDVRFVITDSDGNRYVSPSESVSFNVGRDGGTMEDRFYGVVGDTGISEVDVFGVYYGEGESMPYIEIDHIQYGRVIIPEPGSVGLVVTLSAGFLCSGRIGRVVASMSTVQRQYPSRIKSICMW